MKKMLFLPFGVLVFFGFFSVNSEAQWIPVSTIRTTPINMYVPPLAEVRFIREDTIAFFDYFDPPSPSTQSEMEVFKTSNEGQVWSLLLDYYDYSYLPFDLCFPHPDTGFFTYNYFAHTILERTVDGGQNWTMVTAFGPRNIFFLNGNLGYGVNGNIIYKYANDSVFPIDTLTQFLWTHKLFFVNEQTGYMIYSEDYEPPMHHLLKTVDGGFSWTENLSDTLNSFKDLYFPSESIGFVVCSSGDIYRTSDMGDSWSVSNTGNSYLRSISFVDNETGCIIAGNKVLRTDDGGETWVAQDLPSGYGGIDIKMFNDSLGYASAVFYESNGIRNEMLLRTDNGGFTKVQENAGNPLIQVYPNPAKSSVIVKFPNFANIELYDSNARLVGNVHKASNIFKLDISNFQNGLYFIKVIGKDYVRMEKIIKQ